MRLLRFRTSVRMLLLVVAVTAANCWALRWFSGWTQYRRGLAIPAEVGVLPLFNVACIGALAWAASRICSRRDTAEQGRARFAATFFSFHLLVLLGFAYALIPDAMSRYLEPVDYLAGKPVSDFKELLSQERFRLYLAPFECLAYALAISGPLLLLAAAGRALAIRCATRLPSRRFQAVACLVSLGFASVVMTICVTPRPFREESEIPVHIRIVDQSTRQPIPMAFVHLSDAFYPAHDQSPSRAFSDRDGYVRLKGSFTASGEWNLFQTMGASSLWGKWLEISAGGYQTRRIALNEVLGDFTDSARPCSGTVYLTLGESPLGKSFANIAGEYTASNGWTGHGIEITPDGRFTWYASGCTFHLREYGYVKFHDGIIELVPIACPGREAFRAMSPKYRVVPWGNRRFFCDSDDIASLCRDALSPIRPRFLNSLDRIPSLCVDGESPNPRWLEPVQLPAGVPQLSTVDWVRFAIGEMSMDNEDGALRQALAASVRRIAMVRRLWSKRSEPSKELTEILDNFVPEPVLAARSFF